MKLNWPRFMMIIFVFCFLATENPLRAKVFGPTEVHKIVYVSDSFDDDEFILIQEAAEEWKQTTHGLATLEVIRGYDAALLKNIEHDRASMVVMRASVTDPAVRAIDAEIKSTALGYFWDKSGPQSIILVPGRMLGEDYYRSVIIHEMGHAIALDHLDKELTVMYPSMDQSVNHLTKDDIEWFCRVYYCDYTKLGGN